jgi:cytochrome c oxidase assembly protein subunit 15
VSVSRGRELFRWSAVAAFLSCYATILLGGEVIASDSGLGCPDWPSCHGTFLPPFVGATAVEWSHRLGAATLTILLTVLFVSALLFERRRPTLVRLASVAFSTVLIEALLGGIVVESQLTVWLVLVHFAVATVLLGLLALIVLLSHLPQLPKRWVDWAREAATDRPLPGPSRPTPAGPVPGGPPVPHGDA